ncbi:histidinol dehydrogenase [Aspergillus venezuelensis]
MHLAGASQIYILGGVQAIAPMAIGTESMGKVDFIAGPGNAFVAEAKRQFFGEIEIDLFAGPTEILIVADEYADPVIVATDILSLAEHGVGLPGIIVTDCERVERESMQVIAGLLKTLLTVGVADGVADEYAFGHVQVLTERPREALGKMSVYGALFLGEKACVSDGDHRANHVLPTKNAARYTGGLWVGKFLRTVTYQEGKSDKANGELDLRAKYLGDQYDWISKYEEVGGSRRL